MQPQRGEVRTSPSGGATELVRRVHQILEAGIGTQHIAKGIGPVEPAGPDFFQPTSEHNLSGLRQQLWWDGIVRAFPVPDH